jgi:thiamine-phosphate pyrophosphorylase
LTLNRSKPLVYLITDRSKLTHRNKPAARPVLINFISEALSAGVDMVQIRERDLSARDLSSLAEHVADVVPGANESLLINDRADVAASLGCGVHLTTRSLPAGVVRAAFGPEMLVGVSTHNLEEAREAEIGGADFIVFGPVFDTESKRAYGPPVGLEPLRAVAARSRIPVLALGGVSTTNFQDALDAGAAGIAAISLFTEADDLRALVRRMKNFSR